MRTSYGILKENANKRIESNFAYDTNAVIVRNDKPLIDNVRKTEIPYKVHKRRNLLLAHVGCVDMDYGYSIGKPQNVWYSAENLDQIIASTEVHKKITHSYTIRYRMDKTINVGHHSNDCKQCYRWIYTALLIGFNCPISSPSLPTSRSHPLSDMENKWYRVLCTEKVNIFLWNVEKYECMSHGGAIEHRHCLQKWEREKNKLNKQTCGNSSRQGACCNLQTARDSHGRFSYTVIVPVLPKCSGCRLLLHLMTLCHGSVPKSGKQRARETSRTKKKRKKK